MWPERLSNWGFVLDSLRVTHERCSLIAPLSRSLAPLLSPTREAVIRLDGRTDVCDAQETFTFQSASPTQALESGAIFF